MLGLFKIPGKGGKFAECQCECGAPPKMIPLAAIRSGASQSCGCLHRERISTHGAWGKPLFNCWSAMRDRCLNPKNKRFDRYGGRGIKVCDRWMDYANFEADMGAGFSPGLTIDRSDNDGPYEPGNCRWATRSEQNRNYSRNRYLEHDGRRLLMVDWAAETGLSVKRISARLKAGMTVDDALTKPIMPEGERVKKASQIRWANAKRHPA